MALNPLVGCFVVQVALTRAQLVSTILDLQYSSALLRGALIALLSPTTIDAPLPREPFRSLRGLLLAPGLERQRWRWPVQLPMPPRHRRALPTRWRPLLAQSWKMASPAFAP